jgi:hypothetical protein
MTRTENLSSQFPPISEFLIPGWRLDGRRLIQTSIDTLARKSNAAGIKTPVDFPASTLARLSTGFLLDVGCGINFGRGNSLVDVLPNAYGIDPALFTEVSEQHGMGIAPKDRVMRGYAEDLPFRDGTFTWTFSLKCVGWYPNVTINPYWAISEMVRVTEDGGLVHIQIGQSTNNRKIILDAANKVTEGPLSHRIETIKDFTDQPASQIVIRLKTVE